MITVHFIGGPMDGRAQNYDCEPGKLPLTQYAMENLRPLNVPGLLMQEPKDVVYRLHRWLAEPYEYWFYVLNTLSNAESAAKIEPIIKRLRHEASGKSPGEPTEASQEAPTQIQGQQMASKIEPKFYFYKPKLSPRMGDRIDERIKRDAEKAKARKCPAP